MGRMIRLLGDASEPAALDISSDFQNLTWFAPAHWPDPVEVRVGGQLFARNRGGVQATPWIQPGGFYIFELFSAGQPYLALSVDATQDPYLVKRIERQAPPVDAGEVPYGPPAPQGGGNWFSESTDILGTAIPNAALAGLAGVALLAMLKSSKGR